MSEMNDFENFLRHRDFGKILQLAGTLKEQQNQLATLTRGKQHEQGHTSVSSLASVHTRKKTKTGSGTPQPGPQFSVQSGRTSSIGQDERHQSQRSTSLDSAAELIRASLIPSSKGGSEQAGMMGRGECLVTDSLVDETIRSLADELKVCLNLKKQLREMPSKGSRVSGASSRFDEDEGTYD